MEASWAMPRALAERCVEVSTVAPRSNASNACAVMETALLDLLLLPCSLIARHSLLLFLYALQGVSWM